MRSPPPTRTGQGRAAIASRRSASPTWTSLERNILAFSGIAPIHETLIGTVAALDAPKRQRWLDKMRALGKAGA